MDAIGFLRRGGWTAVLLAALAVGSCGGGGYGGSGSYGAGPVIGLASDYWAAPAGGLWVYDGRDNTSGRRYRNQATIGAPLSLGGRMLVAFSFSRLFNDPAAGVQYRSYESDGVRAYLDDPPSDLARSYLEMPSAIRQGSYTAYRQSETTPAGTLTTQIDVNFVGLQSLALPAGTIGHALKAEHRFTATLTTPMGSFSETSTLHLWYAKGIGVVKQVFDDPSAAPATSTYVEELAGARVGATRAGVLGELPLLANLAPAVSDLTTGRPGVASDGSGYLVAARRLDGTTLDTEIVATYLDGQGQALWSKTVIVDLGNASGGTSYPDPVAASFDGTNFWLVARRSELNSQVLVRQRISPAGDLLDPAGGTVVGNGFWPTLASNGGSVLLAYSRFLDAPFNTWVLFKQLVGCPAGAVCAEQTVAPAGAGGSIQPAATASGGQYLVAFQSGDPPDLRTVRIDSFGIVLDLTPRELSTATGAQESVAVSPWGANAFAALWADWRNTAGLPPRVDIVGARIDAAGNLLDGPAASGGVPLDQRTGERFGVAAATGATGTLLAWTRGSFPAISLDPSGVFARRFADGVLSVADPESDGVLVGLLGADQPTARVMAPAAAASASGHLVAWVVNEESSGAQKRVDGALVFPPLALP